MKKRDFQATVKTLVTEHYGIKEQTPFNDAGEPTMTHQQYRDYSEPSEENPDADMSALRNYDQNERLSPVQAINWRELFDTLFNNTRILDQFPHMGQDERKKMYSSLTYVSDLTEHSDQRAVLSHSDLRVLVDANIVGVEKNTIWLEEPYMEYGAFMNKVQEVWAAAENGTGEQQSSGGNDSEAPYMRGYEPMSEEFLGAMYEHFKAYLKEGISKLDFSKKIRGVVYEYAQGAPAATPTTADPVRDPDNIKQQGEDMQAIGKKIEDVGKTAEEIKNKNAVKGSVSTPTLREYVEEAIFPAVLDIMKEAERPRATKRELLEMFKLGK